MRRALVVVGAVLATALAVPASSAAPSRTVVAGDWSDVYGDSGTGSATDDTSLSAADLPSLGRGWSAGTGTDPFLVTAGLVIATTGRGLAALDQATGKVLWTDPGIAPYQGMVADGGQLFVEDVESAQIGVVALDLATGVEQWRSSDPNTDGVSGYNMAVSNGKVFAFYDEGLLQAYDEDDGSLVWQTEGLSEGVSAANGWVFANDHGTALVMDADTGARVWTAEADTDSVPSVIGGRIVVGTRDGHVSAWPQTACSSACPSEWTAKTTLPSERLTGDGDVIVASEWSTTAAPSRIEAFHAGSGYPLWSATSPGQPEISAANGLVYTSDGGDDGPQVIRAWPLAGCGATTCPTTWTYRFPTSHGEESAQHVVPAHGRLFVNLGEAGMQALVPGGAPYFQADATTRSGIGVVSMAPGRLDEVGVDVSGALEHRYRTNGVWSPWHSLGGTDLVGTPAVASSGSALLDVFVRTRNGSLQHIAFDKRWSGFARLATGVTGDPAAVASGGRALDVFWPSAGVVEQRSFRGRWLATTTLVGSAGVDGLSAASMHPGRIDLMGVSSSGQLLQAIRLGGTWREFERPRMLDADSAVAAGSGTGVVSRQNGHLDVVYLSGAHHNVLDHAYYDRGQWHVDGPVSTVAAGPSIASTGPRLLDAVGVNRQDAVQQLSFLGSGWASSTP